MVTSEEDQGWSDCSGGESVDGSEKVPAEILLPRFRLEPCDLTL